MKETKMARVRNAEKMAKEVAKRILSNAEHNHRDLKGHEGELTIRVDGDYDLEVVEKILIFFGTVLRDWADEEDRGLSLTVNQGDYDDFDDCHDCDHENDGADDSDETMDKRVDRSMDSDRDEDMVVELMDAHREEFEKLKPLIAKETGYPKSVIGEVLYAEIAVMFKRRLQILLTEEGTEEAMDLTVTMIRDIAEFVGVDRITVMEILGAKYRLEETEEDDDE